MVKRLSSVFLCYLAGMVLLAHSFFPHKHAVLEDPATHPHCTAYQIPSDCCESGDDHFHDYDDTHNPEFCILTNVIYTRITPLTVILKQILHKYKDYPFSHFAIIDPVLCASATLNSTGYLSIPGITDKPTNQVHSGHGLRAPPLV